jgi:hypothetical protein
VVTEIISVLSIGIFVQLRSARLVALDGIRLGV